MSKIHKQSDQGWGTTPYTGETSNELQNQEESHQYHKMPTSMSETYGWVLSGQNVKNLKVVDLDMIDGAIASVGAQRDHFNAFGVGTLEITTRWTLSVLVEETNIDLVVLFNVFKRWANNPSISNEPRNHRLELQSMKDKNGIPFPIDTRRTSSDPGSGWQTVPKDWPLTDRDPATDIQIQDNDRGKFPGQGDLRIVEYGLTDTAYQCPNCRKVFESYREMLDHSSEHIKKDQTGPEYEYHEKGGINGDSYDNEASRPSGDDIMLMSATKKKKEAELEGPIPFSYDVEDDRIYVGEPGDERVEIDQSNAFGLAEGYYTPDGDLLITAQATIPYTISHLMHLWDQMHPEYEIKHVYIIETKGGKSIKEKVANA